MAKELASKTSLTLLKGLIPHSGSENQAWERFQARYGPRICGWCQARGLQKADAEDVTQDVMFRLFKYIAAFVKKYDGAQGAFHGWLYAVVRNAIRDYVGAQDPGTVGAGDSAIRFRLEQEPLRTGLAKELEEVFDLEILARAEELVRKQVGRTVWQAYLLREKDRLGGAETAQRLHIQRANVFVYQSRVKLKLAAMVARLQARKA